jgi:beta-lactamase class A
MISRRQWMGGAAMLALGGTARAEDGMGSLPAAFARIEERVGGRLGVAVLDTGSGRVVGHRVEERFPMASTFKAPLAGAVLARADAGQERLDRRIRVTREDLVTHSPVTEKAVGGEGMTLEALCEATMTISDNAAANLLLGAIGGPAALTAFFRGIGDPVSRLDRYELALNEARPGDPRDTTSPAAMAGTLHALALGNALSPASRERMQRWLRGNMTGGARLRAGLPPGWEIGDRTGTGANGTSNVIGVLWPPRGAAPLVVTAYLTASPAAPAARDAALAEVGSRIGGAFG